MLFYEDDPKPPLLTDPPAIVPSTAWLSEGQAEVRNLWDAGKLVREQEVGSETWLRDTGQELFFIGFYFV